jgi:thiol:disulfide interchange protein DsbC
MQGLYEVRIGTDLFYTDAKGNYLIQGELIDTKARRNLTEDRITKLTAVDFKDLPLRTPSPSCMARASASWPCSKTRTAATASAFERDLQKVDNVTIYLFLYPILSPDSAEKSRNIWCAKDKATAWHDMMLRDKAPAAASCDVPALQRNLALGETQDHRHAHADL